SREWNGSLFIVVPGGSPDDEAVIDLKFDGLAGYYYNVVANNNGPPGMDGRSDPDWSNTLVEEYRIYLNMPTDATYTIIEPSISNVSFSGGPGGCNSIDPLAPTTGDFNFTSNVDGNYHIICDLSGDSTYDMSSDDDLHLLGDATAGDNVVNWDGTDNTGAPIGYGSYDCIIRLTVGEFHWVASDVETSYEGLRMFRVGGGGSRSGLYMYWNDVLVQGQAQNMPNPPGVRGLETSGPDGVWAGLYGASALANSNSRGWGAFNSGGKGNENLLNTYTYIEVNESLEIQVVAEDSSTDADGDGLSCWVEQCTYGTDCDDDDSDDDGLRDDDEVNIHLTDPTNDDSDTDGLTDGYEVGT
ncbi:MAG: hypothetical protein HN348_36080, partial [Proteobacteria bacterium]|nr:hypothetical protein [Pseudomonadota bacterium]